MSYLNTGGRYNPSTDSWIATSTTNAPSAEGFHTAVWTGTEMIIWGGSYSSNYFNTGGRYCAGCIAPQGIDNNTAADLDACADTGVYITWAQDPSDWGDLGSGTRTYAVLRNSMPIASGLVYGTTTYIDSTGLNGTSYTYSVQYVNGCASSTATTGVNAADNIDTVPCPNVGNTLLVNKSGTDAALSWAGTTCPDFATYRIYGATNYSDPFPAGWLSLGLPTGPAFT